MDGVRSMAGIMVPMLARGQCGCEVNNNDSSNNGVGSGHQQRLQNQITPPGSGSSLDSNARGRSSPATDLDSRVESAEARL